MTTKQRIKQLINQLSKAEINEDDFDILEYLLLIVDLIKRKKTMSNYDKLQLQLNQIQQELNTLKKSKGDFKDHLFLNAPVMVRNAGDKIWLLRFWKESNTVFSDGETSFFEANHCVNWDQMRLPTVEESPTDIWLAIDGSSEMPEGLAGVDVVAMDGHGDIYAVLADDLCWPCVGSDEGVTKYMILSK